MPIYLSKIVKCIAIVQFPVLGSPSTERSMEWWSDILVVWRLIFIFDMAFFASFHQVSFRSYWTRVILEVLRQKKGIVNISEIVECTAIKHDDIVHVLSGLNLLKYWRGQHMVQVVPKLIDEHLKALAHQRNISIDAARLHFKPIVLAPPKKAR